MNKTKLAELKDIALSDSDLSRLLEGKNNLILYPDLHKYNSIDDVLGVNGMCTLLIESKKNYGHWVCLFKHNNDTVSFFNSYGNVGPNYNGFPDESLRFLNPTFAEENNEDYPYLSELLLKCPYNLTYNVDKFQTKGSKIRTCGRHCVVRLWLKHLSDEEYNKYVKFNCKKYKINPDDLVTLLTT